MRFTKPIGLGYAFLTVDLPAAAFQRVAAASTSISWRAAKVSSVSFGRRCVLTMRRRVDHGEPMFVTMQSMTSLRTIKTRTESATPT